MSTIAAEPTRSEDAPAKRKPRRASTSHLKSVPETLELRERVKAESERFVRGLDRTRPFTNPELERFGRELLERLGLDEKFLGFAMVLIGNYYWREQFLTIPFERRMLLLPHCLKHAEGCPADYDEFGLDCETCGACSIADFKTKAEKLGYKVLVAEGTPIILKLIVGGYVDGILGVACLNVLEKAIDKVLLAGVPSYAIPLHSGDCKSTKFDEPWIWEIIDRYEPRSPVRISSYVPMMRAANDLFEKDYDRLLPRVRTGAGANGFAPLGETESIALDFLAHGGKRFRPFVTLAAYQALIESKVSDENAPEEVDAVDPPDAVRRTAMAIEAFHKASLVHDDIEDDDLFRYGSETLHRRYDSSTAINVGDYLIGVGYRLLSRDRRELGGDVAVDIIDRLGDAHVKLCEGQGAELRWRSSTDKRLGALDALKIYALKTAPAFEAALYAGVRLAGDAEQHEEAIASFSRHLGVGFQILNDLKDWRGDSDNKLVAGQDALALRPTLLLALALDAADAGQREELERMLAATDPATPSQAMRLREIFDACRVFEKAEKLVDKSRDRAEAVADDITPDAFRQLLYFLVDTVLAPEPTAEPEPLALAAPGSLPIISV